ncbi:MAG: DNA primase, partial [Lachnoclostridium sp.]|nr:DNA primase [Lachnoclostridium sp.]
MSDQSNRISVLEAENAALICENRYLKSLLEEAGIDFSGLNKGHKEEVKNHQQECIVNDDISVEQIDLFITLFHGRTDVYARRFISKAGNVGYAPACNHFWKFDLCPKREGKKTKCFDCPKKDWIKLNRKLLWEHLAGNKEDGTDVIGVYPMFPDETCYFLVFDFDNHDKAKVTNENEGANADTDWIEDVNAMREICRNNGVDALVERSRSGKGAHVWIFFESPMAVSVARKFGAALLTKGAESVEQKNFKSYDRMIPAQDKMPVGGLGNLIALPLQGQALRKGNSAFIDENWRVIPDPWMLLKNVKRLSFPFIEEKITEWVSEGVLGVLASDMSGDLIEEDKEKEKPWGKREKQIISKEDIHGIVNIVTANQVYIEKGNIKARALNRFRRLAAFSNPAFYKNMAMGFSTKGIPRIIQCGSDTLDYVCLPRGCEEKLLELLDASDVAYQVTEKKEQGDPIQVSFCGELYPEQVKAAEKMLQHDYGILGAATGFGKTIIGAYLI